MMAERGLSMAHTTIMRWVQRYAPAFEKRWRRFARAVGASAELPPRSIYHLSGEARGVSPRPHE
jgi:hypothetical protein